MFHTDFGPFWFGVGVWSWPPCSEVNGQSWLIMWYPWYQVILTYPSPLQIVITIWCSQVKLVSAPSWHSPVRPPTQTDHYVGHDGQGDHKTIYPRHWRHGLARAKTVIEYEFIIYSLFTHLLSYLFIFTYSIHLTHQSINQLASPSVKKERQKFIYIY